ncbi:putative riboflavin kinase [Helianthus annuus]|nr:putative riboflavin kinase [Helianthus annuus]
MGVDASSCLVIEDSLVGIKAGKAANMQVVAVPSIQTESDEYSIADYVIHSFLDFQPQIWGLPLFDDCMCLVFLLENHSFFIQIVHITFMVAGVMKALPIDPIRFKGSYKNGFLEEISGLDFRVCFALLCCIPHFNHIYCCNCKRKGGQMNGSGDGYFWYLLKRAQLMIGRPKHFFFFFFNFRV